MDFQWISMDFQWISMDFNGFQWISMDFNGFSMDFQWISMDFQWISSKQRGFDEDLDPVRGKARLWEPQMNDGVLVGYLLWGWVKHLQPPILGMTSHRCHAWKKIIGEHFLLGMKPIIMC